MLESLGDHERSSATTCLSDYLAHLAAFSPLVRCCAALRLCWLSVHGLPSFPCSTGPTWLIHLVIPTTSLYHPPTPPSPTPQALLTLTSDWPPSFCRMHALMAAAQLDLLQRLDWRLRLDSATGGWGGLGVQGQGTILPAWRPSGFMLAHTLHAAMPHPSQLPLPRVILLSLAGCQSRLCL